MEQRGWWVAGRYRPVVRAAAALLPLATCAIFSTFRDNVTAATVVLVLVLWVVAVAATGDRLAGIIAAVSGAAWFDFFMTQPYYRFTIDDPDDIEATVLLVLISVAVTEVALWGYRQQAHAARRSGYLEGVLGAARTVAEGSTPTASVVDVVARNIVDVLGADTCRFVGGPVHDVRVALLDHDGNVTRNGRDVDVDRSGLPANEFVAIPVQRGQRVLGHFLVTSATRVSYPSREQLRVAVLLADQVAVTLEDESS